MSPVGGAGGAGALRDIIALRQQIIDRSQLLQQVRPPEGQAPAIGSEQPSASFGEALKGALQSVSAVQKKSEDLSAGYERGEVTDIAKVMLARQESGIAFEATLQVRNRLLSAYQDIMRMGV
jgi:flagellar hook-basal body complex protein FliE